MWLEIISNYNIAAYFVVVFAQYGEVGGMTRKSALKMIHGHVSHDLGPFNTMTTDPSVLNEEQQISHNSFYVVNNTVLFVEMTNCLDCRRHSGTCS